MGKGMPFRIWTSSVDQNVDPIYESLRFRYVSFFGGCPNKLKNKPIYFVHDMILYDIMLYYIILYYVKLYYVMSYDVKSYYIILNYIKLNHIRLYYVISNHIKQKQTIHCAIPSGFM